MTTGTRVIKHYTMICRVCMFYAVYIVL